MKQPDRSTPARAAGNFRPAFQSNGSPARPTTERMVRITFEVPDRVAPALRSAVDEISDEIGGRLEAPHSFAKEQALTDAAIALGVLRSAVNAAVPKASPFYR